MGDIVLAYRLEDKKMIDSKAILSSFCSQNNHKLVFVHLNINSVWDKFELLAEQIKGNMDVLMISETKIDDSFSS